MVALFALLLFSVLLQQNPGIVVLVIVIAVVGAIVAAAFVFQSAWKSDTKQRPQPPVPRAHREHDFRLHDPDVRLHIAGTFILDYSDVGEHRTQRIVDAKTIEVYGEHTYLTGFCHLRQDMRTFRFDRIASLIDQSTGEVIESPDVEGWLIGKAHD